MRNIKNISHVAMHCNVFVFLGTTVRFTSRIGSCVLSGIWTVASNSV